MLELGRYQTRNGRNVILRSSSEREVKLVTGDRQKLTFYQGTLFAGDQKTPECDYEWVKAGTPGTLGEFVLPHTQLPAGQTTMRDLVVFVGQN